MTVRGITYSVRFRRAMLPRLGVALATAAQDRRFFLAPAWVGHTL